MRYAKIAYLAIVLGWSLLLLWALWPRERRAFQDGVTLEELLLAGVDFESLTDLKRVYVDGDITIQDCEKIVRIPNLEALDVVGSNLAEEELRVILSGTSLRRLILRDTNISDASTSMLAEAPSLEMLDIGGTKVTEAGVIRLLQSPALREMVLYGIPLSDNAVCAMAKVNTLRYLALYIDGLTDRGIRCLGRMTELRYLEVLGRLLLADEVEALGPLQELTYVRLRVDVQQDQMQALSKCVSLEEIEIWCVEFKVDFDALLTLKALKRLRKLTVKPYELNSEDRKAFKAAMPGVEFIDGK